MVSCFDVRLCLGRQYLFYELNIQSMPGKFKCLRTPKLLNLSEVTRSAGQVQIYPYSTMELNLSEEQGSSNSFFCNYGIESIQRVRTFMP